MPRFDAESFQRQLRTRVLGRTCYAHEVLTSTNTTMFTLGRLGDPEGTIVVAERQTAGRGQADKVWISPPHRNLYVSVLLRPAIAPAQAPLLSLMAAAALVDTLRRAGAVAGIKWPNDVLIQERKVAGILTEMELQHEAVQFVVVGIGVNVNMTGEELEQYLGPIAHTATSLQVSSGRALSREALLANLLQDLEQCYNQFCTHGAQVLHNAWEARSIMHGRRISARTPAATWEGMAEGIDQAGRLRLRQDDGSLLMLTSAEVRFLDSLVS
jgi:BirA family transcriptional regulator, biotin operon repressor / biotin---[acetyl-CoA-carboxylase] ligase